jgi:hypothetical protein
MSSPSLCFLLVLVAIYVPMAAVGYYNLVHHVNIIYCMCSFLVLVAIYVPMAAVGYYKLGHHVKTNYVFYSSSCGYICAHG